MALIQGELTESPALARRRDALWSHWIFAAALLAAAVDAFSPRVLVIVFGLAALLVPVRASLARRLLLVGLVASTDIGVMEAPVHEVSGGGATAYAYNFGGLSVPVASTLIVSVASALIMAQDRPLPAWLSRRLFSTFLVLLVGSVAAAVSTRNPSAQEVLAHAAPWIVIACGLVVGASEPLIPDVIRCVVAKALVTVLQFVAGSGLVLGDFVRPTFDSIWLAYPLVLAWAIVLKGSQTSRLVAIGAITSAGVISYTRQAWVGLLLVPLLLAVFYGSTRQPEASTLRRRILASSALGVSVALLTVVVSPAAFVYISRFETIPGVLFDSSTEDADLRWFEFRAINDEVDRWEAPVGGGFGATYSLNAFPRERLSTAAFPTEELRSNEASRSHIPVATVYLTVGLFGVGLWLYLAFGALVVALKHRHLRSSALVFAGAPLLLLGPWTVKLEFLAGLVAATVYAEARRSRS